MRKWAVTERQRRKTMKQIILSLVVCSIFLAGSALAYDLEANKGTGINGPMPPMYFDSRTGHKYVKSDDNSYDEFSKKGKFLKTVPADLPLLVSGKKVYPITEDFFILYKKIIIIPIN